MWERGGVRDVSRNSSVSIRACPYRRVIVSNKIIDNRNMIDKKNQSKKIKEQNNNKRNLYIISIVLINIETTAITVL